MLDPARLWAGQNRDGGWGYRNGTSSATEATLFAILALAATSSDSSSPAACPSDRLSQCAQALDQGIQYLKSRQRSDGGWAPRDIVDQSTWVTALPLLLPASLQANFGIPRAVDWLVGQTGRESGWVYRLRLFLMGTDSGSSNVSPGWPWYPETAAWVSPTALTLLALRKLESRKASPLIKTSPAVKDRCEQGRDYLLARRCADGGWNHGSTRALGYDGPSYPETTGVALLALRGVAGLDASLERAERHAADAKSLEAASWLRLGLAAHGRPAPLLAADLTPRTTVDLALGLIASANTDVFWDRT